MVKTPIDPAAVAADPQVKQATAANTIFGFRLLAHLNKGASGKNVFFSPFSVSDALAMTLNGASGDTQQAISKALGLHALSCDEINHANGLLLPSLENPDPQVELSVANALWADEGMTFAPEFQRRCRRFYDATATSLDFHSPSAADTINGWVRGKTQGKIDRLVSATDLVQSPAVLTNAVYFHGQWSRQFNKAATQDGPFTLEDGVKKTVPLMSEAGTYAYSETPQFQAVSLPYGSGRMSLYVFLPKPGTDLNALLNALDGKGWQDGISRMHPTLLTLVLPRFKAQYEARLREPLTALGMGGAFGAGAYFRPMGLRHGFIGEVIHKAILEVDERGTVAAAATGVVMRSLSIARPSEVMRVDHPFFCAIRDNATGTLLFVGTIRDPQ
jgi:serine protease inhibitor